jgi:pilus assembly protein Flp/PilA
MIKLQNTFRRFLKDTRGANLVEYIILVGVVALISIAAFKAFGGKVQEKIKAQGDTVGQVNAGSGQLERHGRGLPLEGSGLGSEARRVEGARPSARPASREAKAEQRS